MYVYVSLIVYSNSVYYNTNAKKIPILMENWWGKPAIIMLFLCIGGM